MYRVSGSRETRYNLVKTANINTLMKKADIHNKATTNIYNQNHVVNTEK